MRQVFSSRFSQSRWWHCARHRKFALTVSIHLPIRKRWRRRRLSRLAAPASPILDSSSYTETGFTIGADSVSFSFGPLLLSFPETFTFFNSEAGGGIDAEVDGGIGRILLSTACLEQFLYWQRE